MVAATTVEAAVTCRSEDRCRILWATHTHTRTYACGLGRPRISTRCVYLTVDCWNDDDDDDNDWLGPDMGHGHWATPQPGLQVWGFDGAGDAVWVWATEHTCHWVGVWEWKSMQCHDALAGWNDGRSDFTKLVMNLPKRHDAEMRYEVGSKCTISGMMRLAEFCWQKVKGRDLS